MADTISLALRRRIVRAYRSGLTSTYEETAEMFEVGRASVSRLLRRDRETGDVLPKRRGGDLRRLVDLAWIEKHAEAFPDARLVDRIEAWQEHSGRRVSVGAMWSALERDRPEVQAVAKRLRSQPTAPRRRAADLPG
jgi:transposase